MKMVTNDKDGLNIHRGMVYSSKQETTVLKFRLGQCAKKVVSDSPGLVDFAIGLVNSVFNLPDGQVMFFEEFE